MEPTLPVYNIDNDKREQWKNLKKDRKGIKEEISYLEELDALPRGLLVPT
jgi:hypothetical protein